jgi:hypothetical protein
LSFQLASFSRAIVVVTPCAFQSLLSGQQCDVELLSELFSVQLKPFKPGKRLEATCQGNQLGFWGYFCKA